MHRGLVLSFKRRNSWTAALELAIRFGYSIWMYVNKVHLSCPFAESEENWASWQEATWRITGRSWTKLNSPLPRLERELWNLVFRDERRRYQKRNSQLRSNTLKFTLTMCVDLSEHDQDNINICCLTYCYETDINKSSNLLEDFFQSCCKDSDIVESSSIASVYSFVSFLIHIFHHSQNICFYFILTFFSSISYSSFFSPNIVYRSLLITYAWWLRLKLPSISSLYAITWNNVYFSLLFFCL